MSPLTDGVRALLKDYDYVAVLQAVRHEHMKEQERIKAELDAKRKALAEEYKAAGLPMRTRKAKGAA